MRQTRAGRTVFFRILEKRTTEDYEKRAPTGRSFS